MIPMRFSSRFKYIILLCLWVNLLQGQDWVDLMKNDDADFRQAQESFEEDWSNRDYQRGNGFKQFKRWENFIIPRMDKYGKYDPTKAWSRFARYRKNLRPNARVVGSWSQLGPFSPPGGYNSSGIGRIDCIAFHPQDSTNYWVGAPSGGLWHTTNNGQSWTTSSDSWEGLGISDILIDPKNPQIMYVATGDRDHYAVHSYGVLKSIDGGTTWSSSGLNTLSRIYKLVMDKEDSKIILAATCCGLYRTIDGGLNWTLINSIPANNIYDIAFKPGDNTTVYAISYDAVFDHDVGKYIRDFGFHKSTDNGITFNELALPFPKNALNRAEIGVSANAPNQVYLYCSEGETSAFYGLYKSTNSGASFAKIAGPSDQVVHPESSASLTINDVLLYQGWYDWTMQINPLNVNEMYLGGAGMIRTRDGGSTWEYIAGYNSGAGAIHVDFHAVEYNPITNRVFLGSDGGVWREPYTGLEWTPLNDGLITTQNYSLSSSPNGKNILVGNQDNSTFYFNGEDWDIITGGDGMQCVIDPARPEILYTSSQLGLIYKIDNGKFGLSLSSQITNQASRWETVLKMDPSFRNVLYTLYEDVWKTSDGGDSWQNISNGKIDSPHQVLELIEIAPSDPDRLYVADRYELFKTTDGGETWNSITRTWDIFEGIGDIEIDPEDPNRVWVVTWSGRVFQTENGGDTWANISGTLPNLMANKIVYQKGSNDGLYLAMDVGVFYKDNTMSDWIPFYTDLPNVVVLDLEILYCTGNLRAGTYGRGMWETPLVGYDPSTVCCNNDLPVLTTQGEVLICGEPSYMIGGSRAPNGSTYQWYKDGRPILGATTTSYEATETGVYTLRFVNGTCSSYASDPIGLTLLPNGICTESCMEMNINTPNGPGNRTFVNITDSLHTPDPEQLIWICVTTEGDTGTEEEIFNVYDENNRYLGATIFGRDCSGPSPEACFYVKAPDFINWISDGVLTVSLDPQTKKVALFCERNAVCVNLRYSIPFADNCEGDLAVPFTRDGVTYKAGEHLTSDATVSKGNASKFTAGQIIDLQPGFYAEGGSDFTASIEACASLLPPEILSPKANSFVDNGCETSLDKREWRFEWTDLPGATSYHFLVYSSNNLAPMINEEHLSTNSFTIRDFNAIKNKDTNNWKAIVRARVEGKWTGWSQILPFNVESLNTDCPVAFKAASTTNTVDASDTTIDLINPLFNKKLRLNVHPNPATDYVSINYFLNKVITFDINLFDVTGKRLREIRPLKQTDPGEHSIQLNTSDLEEGMYFIVIKNKDFTISEKIVILRR